MLVCVCVCVCLCVCLCLSVCLSVLSVCVCMAPNVPVGHGDNLLLVGWSRWQFESGASELGC